ncbi:MAG: SUMF1/EgtB/PvdO family nonheme iron enzyme [Candidatus Hydrogenedens sp.]|nr:SUMF1/EgtB/PvdO family nonheme iron enzyme [Candidatus Hydrogenedens sp.]
MDATLRMRESLFPGEPAVASRSGDLLEDPLLGLRLGNYEVCFQLGRGAYGAVYKAKDIHLGRFVALKFLHDFRNALQREQFLHEARAIAALSKHPSIVQIYEWGSHENRDYFVLEFVGSSAQMLLQCNPNGLELQAATRIAKDCAEALAFAHRQNILHRDVKPGNILLEVEDRRAKLADFGLARLLGKAEPGHDDIPGGTPAYMAPEVAAGGPGEIRSDVFSLGASYYELLTGQVPFDGASVDDMLEQVRRYRIIPLRDRRADLPDRVYTLVAKALARREEDRFSGADELAEALDGLLQSQRVAARPQGDAAATQSMQRSKLQAYKKGQDARKTQAEKLAPTPFQRAVEQFRDGEAFERVRQYDDAAAAFVQAQDVFADAERAAVKTLERISTLKQAQRAMDLARESAQAMVADAFAGSLFYLARQEEALARETPGLRDATERYMRARAMYLRAADEARPKARQVLAEAQSQASRARKAAADCNADRQAPGLWAEAEQFLEQARAAGMDVRTAPRCFEEAAERFDAAAAAARGSDDAPRGMREVLGMTFAWIPPGTASIGNPNGPGQEKPVREVTLTDGFWMGVYPVTQAAWESLMESNPSGFRGGGAQLPVENVSWNDAQRFISRLNEQGARVFRLPSEAEWEYACRAGKTTKWFFGDDGSELDRYAWHPGNADGRTHPVGAAPGGANAWGLHDLHGNVCEWCADAWSPDLRGLPLDGSPLPGGPDSERVARGGSWCVVTPDCHCSARPWHAGPDDRFDFVGLRLVLNP